MTIFEMFLSTALLVIPSVLIFFFLFELLTIIFSLWMLIDCLKRGNEFKDKTLWTILLVLGFFFGYGLIAAVLYYLIVKRELDK